MKSEMLELVILMAEYHDQDLSDAKAKMIASDLGNLSPEKVRNAWKAFRLSPSGSKMPTVGQLLALIDDGNPPTQVAWNLIPKDEDSSVIWSEEMREGWMACKDLIAEGNLSSAFFSFKTAYDAALARSRSMGLAPKWSPSFGFNKPKREQAVIQAIEANRISLGWALSAHPELEYSPAYPRLALKHSNQVVELLEPKNILKNLNIPNKSL